MKKACVLAGIILVVLLAFACEMPSSIEFKSDKFEMNAPIKIANFNLATILSEALKDSFPDDFEMYDMVNYGNGLIQAFLIGYQMDIMESFNPDDYLNHLNDNMDPIDETITIPQMITDAVMEEWHFFPMDAFFTEMENNINHTLTPGPNSSYFTSSPQFHFFKPTAPFDAVFVDESKIEVTIKLDFGGFVPPLGLEITLNNIRIMGPTYYGNQDSKTMILNSGDYEGTVTIAISNARIVTADPLEISIGSISNPASFPFDLVMQMQVLPSITLRGAEKLRSGYRQDNLPSQIIDDFGLDPIDKMINAKIAEGDFNITADPPLNPGTHDKTYSEDLSLNIGYIIRMKQDSVGGPGYPPDNPVGSLNGLNGVALTEMAHSLNGKWINGNALTVDDTASIIWIEADAADGITFELFDDDYEYNGMHHLPLTEKVLPVKVSMKMNIDSLEVVRWKKSILPPIDIPEIDFANMGGDTNVSFIKKIYFDEINLNIDFGENGLPEELKNQIALKVICDDFTPSFSAAEELHAEKNTLTDGPTMLDVENSSSSNKVKFNAELVPYPDENSAYIEFDWTANPVDITGNDGFTMNINGQVTIDFDWTSAEINLRAALTQANMDPNALEGTFPENAAKGDDVDLSPLKKYMNGITFGGVAAKIFFAGPPDIIRALHPELNFDAEWKDDNNAPDTMPMLETAQDLRSIINEVLPQLPGKNASGEWVYSGAGLPGGNGLPLTGFNELISKFPQDLRFHYEMTLTGTNDTIVVFPDTFPEDGDNKIRALLAIQLPLELVAAPGGYFSIPGDLFGDDGNSDLFGRKSPGEDSPFTGVNIKSLTLKMDFGHYLFAGSFLHFDRDDALFGPHGISLGTSNSLNVTFTSLQQNVINSRLIHPGMKFRFPFGKTLQITRNFLPVRIVISASGSYTLDLEDLEL